MKPRYVVEDTEPTPPSIGTAFVANWWPGSYYVVSTIDCAPEKEMAEIFSFLSNSGFLTQVLKADRHGMARDFNQPFYHAEHSTTEEALKDHARVVAGEKWDRHLFMSESQ